MLEISLPIARPPWKKLGQKIESATRKALYEFKMLDNVSKLGLALSGGKDSLTLLYLLHAISGRGFQPFEIYAINVGGPFSCGAQVQQNYLQSICTNLGVHFITVTPAENKNPLECYSCSRTRRKLIFDAAKSVGVDTIAFGHHRDDNAQTLFLNLFHKGEFAGMQPSIEMVDYGMKIIRPLIYISEKDIKQFAKEYGFARVTCQCPVGQDSMRKKVDHLLTELESLFPNVRANVSAAALNYGSDKAIRKPPEN